MGFIAGWYCVDGKVQKWVRPRGNDTHLGGGCVVSSGWTSQEWSVSLLGGVQQWVGPGGDRHIVGGGDQQLVRPGVEGHAAGCVMWWLLELAKPGEGWKTTGWYG